MGTEQTGSGFLGELFGWISSSLSLPDKFLEKLPLDDDWSLIVKLHAMVEAGLNNAILAKLGAPDLKRIVAKLDTSNTATGKIAFALSLGIISKPSFIFIKDLSELRNHCVHNPKHFAFRIADHLKTLPEKERNALVSHIANALQKPGADGQVSKKTKAVIAGDPAFGITWASLLVMAQLLVLDLKCRTRSANDELACYMAARFDEQHQSTPKE